MGDKDFYNWHIAKQNMHEESSRSFFKEREVWFCRVGVNVGFEQDGSGDDFLRPVLVIKRFNKTVCWAVPLTRTNKKDARYYHPFQFKGDISVAILSQLRLIDTKRLQYRAGIVDNDTFEGVRKKLRTLLS